MEWRDNERDFDGGLKSAAGLVCVLIIAFGFIAACNGVVYLILRLIGAEI